MNSSIIFVVLISSAVVVSGCSKKSGRRNTVESRAEDTQQNTDARVSLPASEITGGGPQPLPAPEPRTEPRNQRNQNDDRSREAVTDTTGLPPESTISITYVPDAPVRTTVVQQQVVQQQVVQQRTVVQQGDVVQRQTVDSPTLIPLPRTIRSVTEVAFADTLFAGSLTDALNAVKADVGLRQSIEETRETLYSRYRTLSAEDEFDLGRVENMSFSTSQTPERLQLGQGFENNSLIFNINEQTFTRSVVNDANLTSKGVRNVFSTSAQQIDDVIAGIPTKVKADIFCLESCNSNAIIRTVVSGQVERRFAPLSARSMAWSKKSLRVISKNTVRRAGYEGERLSNDETALNRLLENVNVQIEGWRNEGTRDVKMSIRIQATQGDRVVAVFADQNNQIEDIRFEVQDNIFRELRLLDSDIFSVSSSRLTLGAENQIELKIVTDSQEITLVLGL